MMKLNPTQKLTSLTIFFPFMNDAGTVKLAIEQAYDYGRRVSNSLEVIAIHGGNSHDQTFEKILEMKKKFSDLRILNCQKNHQGYAVIKYGFLSAKKDWVFYTDGDLQYRMADLIKLVGHHFETGANVVNGYKTHRGDTPSRVLLGNFYATWGRLLFHLPIRDLDCDFRLIQRKYLPDYFISTNASILSELITSLSQNRAQFAEIPVSHQPRRYGTSNYRLIQLIREKIMGDLTIWLLLRNSPC